MWRGAMFEPMTQHCRDRWPWSAVALFPLETRALAMSDLGTWSLLSSEFPAPPSGGPVLKAELSQWPLPLSTPLSGHGH